MQSQEIHSATGGEEMDYKAYLRGYMKDRGITYAYLAKQLGVTRQRAWKLINSKRSIRMDTLTRICDALDIDIAVLF